jgi:hypothetical protein
MQRLLDPWMQLPTTVVCERLDGLPIWSGGGIFATTTDRAKKELDWAKVDPTVSYIHV